MVWGVGQIIFTITGNRQNAIGKNERLERELVLYKTLLED